ncbi:MAG: two-component sensor histidine kinase [Opitutus sp.]|nr:two-component sensor histidine kinase [Opitutus sp.]
MSSFTARLTLRLALLVTTTTVAVLLVGGLLLDRQIDTGMDLLHEVEAKELGELLGLAGGLPPEEVAQRIRHDADSDAALFFIQVAGPDERIVFRSENLGETLLPLDVQADTHWTVRLPFLGRVRLSGYRHGPWRIVIGSALSFSERLLRDYVKISLGLVAGVALFSVGLGYLFSRDTLRPIRAIEATARRIRADNLGERIPVAGHDELASLAALLNETFDRLQASFEQVRRFSADASHELKTPLALVRLNAEKLRPCLAHDEEAGAALEDILEEIALLNQVIDRLLFIAKSESGALALARRPLRLAPWLEAFAEDARALAEDRGVRFALADNQPGEVQADPDLLRQLLLNLVTNAVAVSPPGGTVALESRAGSAGRWLFSITDEGPGLPPEQLTRVFERFVRHNHGQADTLPGRGHGLGLAICMAIAELHGGTIQAENRAEGRGLRLEVCLPVQTA